MTEEDLWARVAKDASAKPYKALALDLAGKAHRRHDQAVETGLSSHYKIENAQARPDAGGGMKSAYEAGLAREAFAQQRGALETLIEAAYDRLRDAANLIADHAKAVAAAIRSRTDEASSAEPQPSSPPTPSPGGPSL